MKRKTFRISRRICTTMLAMLLLTGVLCFCGDISNDSITAEAATTDLKPSKGTLTSVSVTPNSYVYNGSKRTPSYSVYGNLGAASSGTYTISGTTSATNVGTYYITATGVSGGYYSGTSATGKWTITKASNPFSYPSSQSVSKPFSESEQKVSLSSGSNAVGSVSITKTSGASYFKLSGTTLTIAANTPAGTYSVVVEAKAGGNGNYNSKTIKSTVTVTINRLNISPTVSIDDWTYGQTPKSPSVTGNTDNGTVTYNYKTKSAADSTYTSTIPSNAGDYTIRATIGQTTNYNGANVTKDFKILRATINPTVTMNGWTYGETAQEPILTGNSGNGAVSYGYKESTADDSTYTSTKPTNAGDYTVRASIAQSTNYEGASATGNFTISKANISPVINLNGWTYGEPAQSPNVSGNSGGGAVTYEYKLSSADDSTYTSMNPTNVGDYTVRATIEPTTNYNGAVVTKDFTIAKASITPTVTMSGWTFGETPQEPSLSGNPGGGTVTYEYKVSNAPDETYSSTKPSNAGVYTVRATVAETANYKNGIAVTNFTIASFAPSDAVTTVEVTDPTYDGTPLLPTVTVKVLVNGNEVILEKGKDYELIVTPQTEAGDYPFKIEYKNNYNGDYEDEWSVKPAPMPEITIKKDSDNDTFVYGDEITDDKFPVTGIPNNLDDDDYEIKYEWIDKDGNALDDTPTDAGEYKVRAIVDVSDDGNYKDQESDWFDVVLTKRNVTINADEGQWKYYGTDDPTITFTVEKAVANSDSGLIAGDSENLFAGILKLEDGHSENVGFYNIVLNNDIILKNYTVKYDENAVTFEIKKSNLNPADFQLDKYEFTYSGEKNKVQIISNLSKSDYSVDIKSTLSAVKAGTYYVYVEGKDNYQGEVILSWSIKPAAVGDIYIIGPDSIPDDGEPISDHFKVVDSDKNELPDDIINYIWYDAETNEEIDEPTNPGDYKVKAVIDDPNYDDAESEFIEFTIEEKSISDNDNSDTDSNGNGNTDSNGNGDTDSNGNGDTDSNGNGDTDSNGNGDTDSNGNGDTDSNGNGDTDSNGNGDTDGDGNNSDTDSNGNEDTDSNSDSDSNSDIDTHDSPDVPKKVDLIGDTDRNGKITARDSLLAQRAAVRLTTLNEEAEICADVDMDGNITTRDALDILRYAIDLSVKSHVGEEIDFTLFLDSIK